MNFLKTTLLSALLITGLSTTSSVMALSPFQATYQFGYNGKNMGTATRKLSQQNNQWVYQFSASVAGMASASETSRFSFVNGQIQSQSFKRTSKILLHDRTRTINFNPSTKMINTKDKKERSFAWKAGVLDELNAELQVREDLKKGALKAQYYIADAKEVEGRKFVRQGNEQVKTAAGTYNTVKVVMQHSDKNRQTVFWLAPQLDYLPVKVTHKDEDASYSLNLTKFSQ